MRRFLKWAAIVLGVIVALPVVAVIAVLIALNIGPGQRLVERETTSLTGGMVVLTGLSGSFPAAPRVGRVEIHDATGPWLVLQDIALDWAPLALLHRDAHVDRLAIGSISVARLPVSSPQPAKPAATSDSSFSLPVEVDIEALSVGRLDLAAPIAGTPATLAIDGQAHLASLEQGTANLAIRQLDGPGRYTLSGAIDPAHLTAHIALDEPTRGLLSRLGQVPELGALSAKADLDGPRSGAGLNLTLAAGPLRATAKGSIDLVHDAADLDVTASAPHMQPRPDISWNAIALDAHVHGPFTTPDAAGNLEVTQLAAAGAAIAKLTAKLSGNAGQVALDANFEGLRIPGPKPELLAAAPVKLTAQVQLDAPTRPVTFSISHPLLTAKGTATTGGNMEGQVALTLPDLTPLAAIGGVDLQGSTQLAIKAAMAGDTTTADVDGTLHITGGMKPVPGLIGDATLGVTAAMAGQDITLSRLTVDGRTLKLQATGGLTQGRAKADLTLALSDLTVLAPTIAGALQAQGHVEGPTSDFSAKVDLSGDVTIQGHRGPLKATLAAAGLPSAPTGQLQAQGTLDDAPLSLDIGVRRNPDGAMTVAIDRADWKTAHAEGNLALAPGATIPTGHVALRMTRLADLRPLIGQDLVGGVTLDAVLPTTDLLRLQLEATGAGMPGTAEVGHARLTGEVRDPTTHPVVDAALTIEGLRAGAISGNAKLNVRGPQEALAVRLDAGLHGVAGADATVATAATIDAVKREVALASLTADWKGLAARLLGPARIGLAQGVNVDHLRLGLGQAEIDVAGRATPTLDLTVAVRRVTPDLARLFVPDLQADGTLTADAHLTGTPARPTGTVKLVAAGLHMRSGPARTLPPASLNANAELQGISTRLDVRLEAGTTRLAVTGQAPLAAAGAIDLHATGGLNLAMLDPILSAQGRRLRGQVSLDATATGTIAAPRLAGTAQLTQGELQDFAQGVHLTAMQATLQASGEQLRIASFSAHAGAGTITAAGTVGVLAPGIPVDITITARNAKPLASDLITAVLDADLTVRGQAQGHLAAGGKIVIRTANIQVPETLPTSIAVLNVRVPGQKPPPPPSPGPDVALDLTLQAPQGIFVRGRGLDAELGGEMHVGGTAAAPRPTGGFQMRRGIFSLAGVTLTFSTGEVTFNGASKIDPTLNFIANSANSSVIATLTVGGYASAPKITLSSVPELPQDEVLAHLLFNTSASNLSAFQLAEIAGALAQISGVTSGVGDPLAKARKALGLDQLNVGSSSTGSPTLDAGRYVAKGVYVGAKQGLGGNAGTQATVQIDIAKGLKLETDAGSGTGANSVGLTYQFEY